MSRDREFEDMPSQVHFGTFSRRTFGRMELFDEMSATRCPCDVMS